MENDSLFGMNIPMWVGCTWMSTSGREAALPGQLNLLGQALGSAGGVGCTHQHHFFQGGWCGRDWIMLMNEPNFHDNIGNAMSPSWRCLQYVILLFVLQFYVVW